MSAGHPDIAGLVRRVQASELNDSNEQLAAWAAAFTAKEQRVGTIARWMPLITGGLQPLRLKTAYVDVTESSTGGAGRIKQTLKVRDFCGCGQARGYLH